MEIILFSTKSMACQASELETQEEKIPVTVLAPKVYTIVLVNYIYVVNMMN